MSPAWNDMCRYRLLVGAEVDRIEAGAPGDELAWAEMDRLSGRLGRGWCLVAVVVPGWLAGMAAPESRQKNAPESRYWTQYRQRDLRKHRPTLVRLVLHGRSSPPSDTTNMQVAGSRAGKVARILARIFS